MSLLLVLSACAPGEITGPPATPGDDAPPPVETGTIGRAAPDGVVIIDSDNSENDVQRGFVQLSSGWRRSTSAPTYFGTDYKYAETAPVSDGAVFRFFLDSDAPCDIDAWWTAGTNRSASAPFLAFDAQGNRLGLEYVNQQQRGGQWNAIGRYEFTAGWNAIVLSRWSGAGKVVIADAIRVTPEQPPVDDPPVDDPPVDDPPVDDPPVDDPPGADLAAGTRIRDVAVYQAVAVAVVRDGASVPEGQRNAPIVSGADAVVTVSVDLDPGFVARPVVAVVTIAGQAYAQTQTLSQSSGSTPTSGFTVEVPGSAIAPGATFEIALREQGTQTFSGSTARAHVGPHSLGAASANGELELVLVPFQYTADGSGRLPPLDAATVERYRSAFAAMYPTAGVNVRVRQAVSYGVPITGTSGWSEWLDYLTDLRRTDQVASNVFYYGVASPTQTFQQFCSSSCITGLGWVPGQATSSYVFASVGVSFASRVNIDTALHEVGHTMGRSHAPCGGVSSSDPAYPYAAGRIGTWGYDASTRQFIEPSVGTDIMGYCNNQWISDYTYGAIFERLLRVNTSASARVIGERQEYRVALVDEAGTLTWKNETWLLDGPAGGDERAVQLLDLGGADLGEVTGAFVPYDHMAGGMLLVPVHGAVVEPSFIVVDGRRARAW